MKKSNYSVLDLNTVRKKSSGIVPSDTILKDIQPIEWRSSKTGDKQNVSNNGHYKIKIIAMSQQTKPPQLYQNQGSSGI